MHARARERIIDNPRGRVALSFAARGRSSCTIMSAFLAIGAFEKWTKMSRRSKGYSLRYLQMHETFHRCAIETSDRCWQSNGGLSIRSSIVAECALSAIIEQSDFAVPVHPFTCVSRQIGSDENDVEPQRLIISPQLFRQLCATFC